MPRYPYLLIVLFACGFGRTSSADEVDYNRDIRPILSDKCYACHGPDEAQRQADLRLDLEDHARQVIEAGNPQASVLYERISSSDESLRMPPPDSERSLSPREIELIKLWITQGAHWKQHWSFNTPERPTIPRTGYSEWGKTPIDPFIFARLEEEGLAPAAEAAKETLIRRVTLDLTGLSPSLAEIDTFLSDDEPGAYERVVDRLLKSPRYGEHRARYWLDAARYGDTHGLHLDNERSIWPYRDWVIQAFNNNLRFDQFTVQQLAGDLLPSPTLDQLVATGFNRCNVTTSEGGSIAEEYLVRYAVDRVETTSTVFMGLTTGCAVCHDHKFDPISQKDFYQLFAYFYSLTEKAMDGNALLPPPVIKVPTPQQVERQGLLQEKIAAVEAEIRERLATTVYEEPPEGGAVAERSDYVWIEDELPASAKPEGDWVFVTADQGPVYTGLKASKRTADGVSQHFFTQAQPGLRIGKDDTLFAYVYLDPTDPPKQIMLQFNDGSWDHRAFWGEDRIDWGTAGEASRRRVGPLPATGQWVRLEVTADQVGLSPGSLVNGWAFTQYDGTVYWDRAGVVTATPQDGFDSLLAWEHFIRTSGDTAIPKHISDALQKERDARNGTEQDRIRDHFLEYFYRGTREVFAELHQQLASAQKELELLDQAIPATLIMEDMPQPRQAHILTRGEYDKPGKAVQPGVPAALPPLSADAPPNRLAIAEWLVREDHPLTARVAVNRFWQQIFGTGLVKTTEDFGSQGEWPSHPQLLDWLAVDFIESGWDVKRIIKQMVMSHTYRQSSRVTAELWQRDPANRLLARGPRFRLDAEMIRDQALSASGLLVEQVGGRSVKPYQPKGLWEAVGYTGSNTVRFVRDDGEALFRRSMYTFWKRTAPPPTMQIFDAPSREYCVVRRERTNTPKAALALMNDVQFVEAARHLAARMMKEGGSTAADRITLGFRLVTARRPDSEELSVLKQTFQRLLEKYQADPTAAEELVTIGETPRDRSLDAVQHAAWTMIASMLLNLDETITKG